MRALVVTLVLAGSATVWARPRVQVAPFSVHDESLGYFGPEVARAVAAALEGAGVETGAGAEAMITGRVEPLARDRVRLAATLRGRTLTAEGPLEAMDAVATQLANQIAPLLLENDPAAQSAAEKRAHDAARRAAAVPPSSPASASRVVAAPPPSQPHIVPPAVAAAMPESKESKDAKDAKDTKDAKADGKAETKPEAAHPETKAPTKAPTEAPTEAKVAVAEAAKPEAARAAEAPRSEIREPDWAPPRVDTPAPAAVPARPAAVPARAAAPSPYFAGFVRGRVVAHAVADPQSAYPGSGAMATQALFAFLQRRLRLTVVPTGVGITSAAVAADEGYRAGARAVVMARLDSVDYMPGPSVRCRLEVIVIRDGRPVMRRIVEAQPNQAIRRTGDPLYAAVTAELEALVPELVGALSDVR